MTEVPYGYCRCGCGEKTNVSKQSNKLRGYTKGEPLQYVRGHQYGKPRGADSTELYCPYCKKILPVSDFAWQERRKKYYSYCQGCCTKYNLNQRNVRKYGITIGEVTEMLNRQNNTCPICAVTFREDVRKETYCVDHDHATGRVRGIICYHCNLMLGHAKDNVDVLAKAIDYLQKERN